MKLLIVWNGSSLSSKEMKSLGVDSFCCLFNKKNLFREAEDHFYVDEKNILSNENLCRFLESHENGEIIFHSNELGAIKIMKQLGSFKAQVSRYKRFDFSSLFLPSASFS